VKVPPFPLDPRGSGRDAAPRERSRGQKDGLPAGSLPPPAPSPLAVGRPPAPVGSGASAGRPSQTAPAPAAAYRTPEKNAAPTSDLLTSLARLRQRFRDVASLVEGLTGLRSLGGEEALIEMAMFAQSHEQTLERAWRALDECEQHARGPAPAPPKPVASSLPASEPVSNLSTEPAPVSASAFGIEEAEEDEDAPVTQVDVGASCVLVVDDDPTVLRAFRRVLQGEHEILTARDGSEALRMVLGGARVDAIICDIGMPKLDGPAFFSELFELRPQLMPRVVFCTGGLPNEKTQRFLDRLQAPLLYKPVAASDLLRAIESVRGH
jgi:CheY-like chemotaxis protein